MKNISLSQGLIALADDEGLGLGKKGKRKREKGVSQHILTDETGSRRGHFFGFAFLQRGILGARLTK